MLRKCLKYDFRAVGKIWWIAALTMLVLSIPGGVSLRTFVLELGQSTVMAPALTAASILGLLLVFFAAAAFVILTAVLLYVRYYTNFFTDEGYLTFTLPVKRQTLFLSKLVNAFLWMLATAAELCLVLGIMLAMTPGEEGHATMLGNMFYEIGQTVSSMQESIGNWTGVMIGEGVVLAVLMLLMYILILYFCITMGGVLAKKHKILVTVGLLYGANTVLSIVRVFGELILMGWGSAGSLAFPNLAELTHRSGPAAVLMVLYLCLGVAAVDVLLACITMGTLERKLNLA